MNFSNVNSLREHHELKGHLSKKIGVENILNLAKDGLCPHYILHNAATKDEMVLFNSTEVEDWLKDVYLKRHEAYDMKPIRLHLMSNTPSIKSPPKSISLVDGLLELCVNSLSASSGIYFLCLNNEVVYVGQSYFVGSRIGTHYSENQKEFDSAFYLSVPRKHLDEVEKVLIKQLNPIYNKTANAPFKCSEREAHAKEILNGGSYLRP